MKNMEERELVVLAETTYGGLRRRDDNRVVRDSEWQVVESSPIADLPADSAVLMAVHRGRIRADYIKEVSRREVPEQANAIFVTGFNGKRTTLEAYFAHFEDLPHDRRPRVGIIRATIWGGSELFFPEPEYVF